MTKAELLVALESVPDDTVIVIPGYDHTYFSAEYASEVYAHEEDPGSRYGQYGGSDCEADYGRRVSVFLIGT